MAIRGHAWAGELEVSKMEYSIDFGATWQLCTLENPENRLAWQHFKAQIIFPKTGYYEIWAKATDANGDTSDSRTNSRADTEYRFVEDERCRLTGRGVFGEEIDQCDRTNPCDKEANRKEEHGADRTCLFHVGRSKCESRENGRHAK